MPPRRAKLSDKAARHDTAYQRAKNEGFAARAVYKLEEIDRRFSLLRRGAKVLDLGCWPGSWMQYCAGRVGEEGLVLGVDLRPVAITLPAWCTAVVGDVERWMPPPELRFDVVLSDMAPQTIGDRHIDQWRSEELCRRALEIAAASLRPGGHFVAKVFQGGAFPELLTALRATFQEAKAYHAKNTRATSTEQYLIGRGLRASRAADANTAS